MDPLSLNLVMIAGLFLLGAVGEAFFARTQIPDVVWLIGAGVLLNASGLVEPDAFDGVLPLFAALTLIIILFEGGSQIVVGQLVKSAPRATALALLGFVFTVAFVAVLVRGGVAIGMLPESWGWAHGFMVGAMLGGSSSLIIMPSMTLAKVEEKVANLVGLESALTDALCVVVAVAIIDTLAPASGGAAEASDAALTLAKSFGIALVLGLVAGWTWMPIMSKLAGSVHAYPVTLAMLLMLYVLVGKAGGSSAMGILAFAVVVGNADALMKSVFSWMGIEPGDKKLELDYEVRTVHTQISFIIKSFFFTFIGLKLNPPWSMIFAGVIVGIALLGSRVPVVAVAARGDAFSSRERGMITISLPRGMAAGVLATLPMQAGIPDTETLPSLVFAAVITSILIFAVGFRKIRMAPAMSPALAAELARRAGESDGEAAGGEATDPTDPNAGPNGGPEAPDSDLDVDSVAHAPTSISTTEPVSADGVPPVETGTQIGSARTSGAPPSIVETAAGERPLPSARDTVTLGPGEAPSPPPVEDPEPLAGAAPSGFVAVQTEVEVGPADAGPTTIPGVPRPPDAGS